MKILEKKQIEILLGILLTWEIEAKANMPLKIISKDYREGQLSIIIPIINFLKML